MKTKKQIKQELAKEYYGKEAEKYEEKRLEDPRHAHIVKKQEEITSSFLKNENYKNILDVACGTGRFFKLYKGKIYGIDFSEDMLKQARKKKHFLLKKADASKIPFKNNMFDITITSQFIKHTPEYEKVIKEMTRVTKKGGKIIIDFPNKFSITNPVTKLRIQTGKLRHYNFFSIKDINAIARKNNLEIEAIEPTVVISPLFFPKSFLSFSIRLNNLLTKLFPRLTYVYYVKFRKK